MSHSTQNRSFQRRYSQPISWLGTEKKPNPTKQTTQNQSDLTIKRRTVSVNQRPIFPSHATVTLQ